MPHYFAGIAGFGCDDGSMHLSTVRPGHYGEFLSPRPVHDMEFPIDYMRQAGTRDFVDHDAVLLYVQAQSAFWYHGYVQKAYHGDLDLYIQFSDSDMVHYYVLHFDEVADMGAPDNAPMFPMPCDWYNAARRRYVHSLTQAEWAAMAVVDNTMTGGGSA